MYHLKIRNGVEKITATDHENYHFSHWSNGSTANPDTITLVGDSVVTAYFWSFSALSADRHKGEVYHSKIGYHLEKIVATAYSYYHFAHWSNGSTANPDTISIVGDSTVTAYFISLTTASADVAKGSVAHSKIDNCLEKITATANENYHFSHWSNGSTANPDTISIVGDSTVTAYFISLTTASADVAKGSVAHSKIDNCLEKITATANENYHFSHWSNGSTANPDTITLVGDSSVTAYFARNTYTLSANVSDASLGSVSFPNGDTVLYLDTIMVIAHPTAHYHVDHWSGDNIIDSSDNKDTIRVKMTGNGSVNCYFAIDRHTVAVATSDIVRGMVSASGSEFEYGEPCTVEATAYTGYTFKCWSNGVTANPYIFAVLDNVNLTAIFLASGEETFTVTATSADQQMGSATANGFSSATVMSGETVTLVANANEGYHFVRWNDNNTDATRTITVTSDMSFTAYFEADFIAPGEESFTVTAASADPQMGSATANGFPSATVMNGETVTLTATANNGYHFVRWNDNNTNATRTITVTSDMSFTAYFEADESPTEGIGDIQAEDVKVYARNGHIVVQGAEGEMVRVFDIVGRPVKGQELKPGVYIVKIGLRPAKKMVFMR